MFFKTGHQATSLEAESTSVTNKDLIFHILDIRGPFTCIASLQEY